MVSEESCTLSNKICTEQINNCDKSWLSDGITSMSVAKSQNDNIATETDGNCECSSNAVDDEATRTFIEELILDICDSAISKIESGTVMTRDKKLSTEELYLRKTNRRTSILDDELNEPIECRNNLVNFNLHRRSVSECVINNCVTDENDNNDYSKLSETINPAYFNKETNEKKAKDKDKKKKLSFTFFKKKEKSKSKDHKYEEDSETHDDLPQLPVFRSNTLGKSKKYSSALELHQAVPLHRTPSFIKKLVNISEDSSKFLKRSLSFRELNKKKVKVPSRETLKEKKNQEWKQSLQSLVENDISVSYNDLSFINYDALNSINYREQVHLKPGNTETRGGYIGRTQSMIEKRSPDFRRPAYQRLNTVSDSFRSSGTYLSSQSALSLPSLHHLNQENGENTSESTSTIHRYRRRPQSISSEDGRPRSCGNGSFRSAGSGCAKLKRHNACRQKIRDPSLFVESRQNGDRTCVTELEIKSVKKSKPAKYVINRVHRNPKTVFNIVKIFSSKPIKIARESPNIEREQGSTPEGNQEWKKFVGSIRRKVQRHASGSSDQQATGQPKGEPLSRKNSLTHSKFDMFKKDKSEDKKDRKSDKQPLTKQKSIGLECTSKSELFKALSFKDKSKSVSVKHVDTLVAPKGNHLQKGVRKSDKKDSDKTLRPSISFCRSKSSASKSKEGLKQDDFLKATMRIFLVVSPPAGKIQVRSRSLNHLDTLEMRQGVVSSADAALKDSRSEPDCTRPLVAPPISQEPSTPVNEVPPARKYMLSRSQKSSSECFSVNFEVGDESTWDNDLFFPAKRGMTLHDSLAELCDRHNIDLSACDARLQDKENNVESFILFSQDTASLVGRHVRITAKEPSNKKLSGSFYSNHSRKQSGSYRPRTTSFFSSSTEEPNVASSTLSLHDGDQSKKQIKQRLTAFFGNTKDTKYEALIDQLDKYSKQGIPHIVKYPQGQCESVDALYKLEDDWRDIIEFSDLSEKQQQQQTALWELIKTEVAYIKTLKVVTDLFLACLKDLQSKALLKEIDTDKLFSNITEILDANVVFWRNTLFPLVRDMRKYRRTSCIENMLEGFHTIQDIFQPYYKYCAEQSRCQHYCRENLDSEVFTAYLTWCESQKECNRLRLMDILVQPMQRLTKYGLLLKAILKNTDEDVERENLQTMIKMVDEFVNNVNSSLKHRQDKERLKGIIARIESYDIVESKDDDIEKILKKDKSLTQLDLTRPMLNCPVERKRHLLLEGDLKLKDSGTSKMEVHCFLLTDMLLVCKPSTKKGGATMRVVRQPYLVDRLVVSELHRETPSLAVIYKNEFDMAVAAFILQNNDARKIKGWKEGIAKAQTLYAQAKQMSYMADESQDADYSFDYNFENEYPSLQLIPRSPLASSSRASRVSSLAHSHSGSVEMNDQSSVGSVNQSRAVSMETENRTGSISSDEGVQPLPPDKSPVSQKNSFKNRLFHKTPNTLSVQPYGSLGQSLPNLTLGSPNVGSLSLNLNQNTLSVPSSKNGSHLLSPTHRGISYPPPSPTRGNLRRSLAISQSKNPPLIKTRQVNSTSSASQQIPTSFDFDVPVIAGVSQQEDHCESFSRGQHRQAIKRNYRYHTAGVVDDIKKNDSRDASIHKRLSWNCTSQEQRPPNEDQT